MDTLCFISWWYRWVSSPHFVKHRVSLTVCDQDWMKKCRKPIASNGMFVTFQANSKLFTFRSPPFRFFSFGFLLFWNFSARFPWGGPELLFTDMSFFSLSFSCKGRGRDSFSRSSAARLRAQSQAHTELALRERAWSAPNPVIFHTQAPTSSVLLRMDVRGLVSARY